MAVHPKLQSGLDRGSSSLARLSTALQGVKLPGVPVNVLHVLMAVSGILGALTLQGTIPAGALSIGGVVFGPVLYAVMKLIDVILVDEGATSNAPTKPA